MTLEQKIHAWAEERGLYDNTTPPSQINKLYEEIKEVIDVLIKIENTKAQDIKRLGYIDELMLELGDCYVVLVNLSKRLGFSLEHCGEAAYEKIKNRTGFMINGTFVKTEDLQK